MRSPIYAKPQSSIWELLTPSNAFLRQVVRRTREYLEPTLNPETHDPYLKRVEVVLHGEGDDEAIALPG
jgi:hypothetical protein